MLSSFTPRGGLFIRHTWEQTLPWSEEKGGANISSPWGLRMDECSTEHRSRRMRTPARSNANAVVNGAQHAGG